MKKLRAQRQGEGGKDELAQPRAKKSLGQNFLADPNIARKIVRTLDIRPTDKVLEIGPGPGALTRIIEECRPAALFVVEKDRHWARERKRLGGGLSVMLADALTLPFECFLPEWKCIGNLPYNVASPLMWELFSRMRGLARAVFMIQKEVGLRVVASPGSSAYGALSVWIQSFMFPKLEFVVPPQVFRPRPKVDSAVLSFVPRAERYEEGLDFIPEDLAVTLKACFQMRRKQLGSIVKAYGNTPNLLENIGIDPLSRPEELTVKRFHMLSGAGIFSTRH